MLAYASRDPIRHVQSLVSPHGASPPSDWTSKSSCSPLSVPSQWLATITSSHNAGAVSEVDVSPSQPAAAMTPTRSQYTNIRPLPNEHFSLNTARKGRRNRFLHSHVSIAVRLGPLMTPTTPRAEPHRSGVSPNERRCGCPKGSLDHSNAILVCLVIARNGLAVPKGAVLSSMARGLGLV